MKLIKLSLRIADPLKTLTAMIIMAAGMSYVYTSVPLSDAGWLQFLFSATSGMALYLGICLLTGLISVRDLDRVPFFKRRR
ncbi:hypothetical protein D3C85_1683220 [compost metagenome]